MDNRNEYMPNSQRYRSASSTRTGALLLEILVGLFLMTSLALGITHYRWHIKAVQGEALKRLQAIQEIDSVLEGELGKRSGAGESGCVKNHEVATFLSESGALFAHEPVIVVTAQREYRSINGPRRIEIKTVLPESKS